MRGGITSFICSSCLVAAGCTTTTQTADIKVRAIPDAAAKLRSGSGVLAEATGQLVLGNVGLALEGFRKALREHPNSAEAYAGIAKCYEAMGRYDWRWTTGNVWKVEQMLIDWPHVKLPSSDDRYRALVRVLLPNH